MKRAYPVVRAMALLITLAFIVLITILIVGLVESARTDRPSASAHLERVMAGQYAQNAVETVIATLRKNTADRDRYWISQPGQITAGEESDNAATPNIDERKVLGKTVLLSSGKPSDALLHPDVPSYLAPPNLNITTLRDPGTHLITDRAEDENDPNSGFVKMRVSWIYVRRDGTLDRNEQPITNNTANPIVGRYAYWTDDESSKVNCNLAWGRSTTPPNSNPEGHPTKIGLAPLFKDAGSPAMLADRIHNFITDTSFGVNYERLSTNGFFNTPSDVRRADAVAAGHLTKAKFEATHYNHDPDTTFFNEPRIVLTTRPERAGWKYNPTSGQWEGGRPYLQILANEGTDTDPQFIPPAWDDALATDVGSSPPFLKAAPHPLDPGAIQNLSHQKLSKTLNFLLTYLRRTDWPMVKGTAGAPSFQSKYYPVSVYKDQNTSTDRLTQLALNIIDYVRSKESPTEVVEPLRVDRVSSVEDAVLCDELPGFRLKNQLPHPDTFRITNSAGPLSYIGLARGIAITEMGFFLDPADTNHRRGRMKYELHLPRNYGIPEFELKKLALQANVWKEDGSLASQVLVTGKQAGGPGTGLSPSSTTKLKAGGYVTITTDPQNFFNSAMPVRPAAVKIRLAVGRWAKYPLPNPNPPGQYTWQYDIAPVATAKDAITFTLDPPTVTTVDAISSLEVDDPRVNKSNMDWRPSMGGNPSLPRNTFGAPNSVSALQSSKPGDPSIVPEQDTNAAGAIDTFSFYMPPPAGRTFTLSDGITDDNTRGMVTSIGELGYVHTGIIAASDNTGLPGGIPWRTLRLRPSKQGTDVVPDWALMDLFAAPTVPAPEAESIVAPRGTSIGGRVNLNSKVEPFALRRSIPIEAVLLGARKASGSSKIDMSSAEQLATNIYERVVSPRGGKLYPDSSCQYYISPGQVVEIDGIADMAESGEVLVREIANLVSARGNVFSVYSIGQSIKQTPAGTLVITAEQRSQVIVERYLDASSKEVCFAQIYSRNLVP